MSTVSSPLSGYLLLCALLCLSVSGSTQIPPPDFEHRVDSIVEEILGCRDILGLSLAVVKGNETLLAKGYGLINKDGPDKVNEDTLFGIASLTKAFTSTLLGHVLTKHGYTWDTPVRRVLGDHGIDFRLHDSVRTHHVTSRDIASHRTGIPKHNYARMQAPTRAEMVRKLRYFEGILPFRGSYHYNNLMYGLMTFITETLEDMTWEDLLHEGIFGPLDMRATTFTHVTDIQRADIAKPVLRNSTGQWQHVDMQLHSDWGELGGSGSVTSNAVDMAQWLKFQLNQGSNASRSVIDSEVLSETHKPVNVITPEDRYAYKYRKPVAPVAFSLDSYAMGWRRGYYRGLRVSVHTGTSWGYGGLIILLHDVDIAIFTAITGSDRDYTGRYTLHMFIIDQLLGFEPWVNRTTACTFPEPWFPQSEVKTRPKHEPAEAPSLFPLEFYTGTFGNYGYGNISFLINADGRLELHYGTIGRYELTSLGGHRFHGQGFGFMWMRNIAWLQFHTDASGGSLERVEIPFDTLQPPTFTRGLKMSDAPDMHDCAP